ncbi:hypothetical protein ACIBKX_11240 [Streptomyces sp. NPDC050658]|uniref:hypothetical protein n=1 Tax=unclassified Streptomyces TaxID=2593676 RepID=UPI0034362BD2
MVKWWSDRSRYVFSYDPLGGAEDVRVDPEGESAAEAAGRREYDFLLAAARMILEGGPRGMELRSLDVASGTCVFAEVEVDPRPVRWFGGVDPAGDVERWFEPQPGSPAWGHLGWLVKMLGHVGGWRDAGELGPPEVLGVEAADRAHADVLVAHAGRPWRVRVLLEGRGEPLGEVSMEMAEMFGEGDYERHQVKGEPGVIVFG